MSDTSRIDDLRRRVHKDPASIAFAQLAEELRRGGDYQESIEVCRAGLAIHPGYLSARVTLGRALLEIQQLDEAKTELELVLKSAPENLAALRALAETRQRQGSDADALASYRSALALAKNDSFLQQAVDELSHRVEPDEPPAVAPPADASSPAPATEFSYAEAAQDLPLHTPPEPVAAFSYAQAIEDLPLHAPPEPVPVAADRENVENLEHIEIPENFENLATPANLEHIEIPESLENFENVANLENFENAENLGNLENLGNFENLENLATPANLEHIENAENPENLENFENLENLATPANLEHIENLENLGNLENFENPENPENPENTAPLVSATDLWAALAAPPQMTETATGDNAVREKAVRTIAALEQWLEAVYVARVQRHA